MMAVCGLEIVAAARRLVGTPTQHQGRLPGVALDCAGLIWCAATAAGIEMQDFRAYSVPPRAEVLLHEIANVCHQIQPAYLRSGDVVCIAWTGTCPMHLGILTEIAADGAWRIVHSTRDRVREQPLDPRMLRRLHSAWRIRGVLP
jgi:cell wall-associated NlpC family hydrolase